MADDHPFRDRTWSEGTVFERAEIVAFVERELAEMPDVGGAGYAQHWGGELQRKIAKGEHYRFAMERAHREARHG